MEPFWDQSTKTPLAEPETAHPNARWMDRLLGFYEAHGNLILIAFFTFVCLITQISDLNGSKNIVITYWDRIDDANLLGFISDSAFDLILLWCSIKCLYTLLLARSEEKKVLAYGLAYWLVVFYALDHFTDQIEKSSGTYLEEKAEIYLEEGLLKAAEFLVILRFIRERSQVLKKKYRPYTKWNMAYDFSFGLIGVKHQPRKLDLDPRGQTTIPSLNPDIRLSQESQ